MKFINIGLIALVIPIAIAFEFVRPVLLSLAQFRAGWIDAVSRPVVWATLIAFGVAPFIAGGRGRRPEAGEGLGRRLRAARAAYRSGRQGRTPALETKPHRTRHVSFD